MLIQQGISLTRRVLSDKRVLFVLASICYLMVIYYGITRKNEYTFAVPFGLLLVYMAIDNFRNVWYLALLLMPLSFDLSDRIPGASITFPTDLLALGLIGALVIRMLLDRNSYAALFNHSLTWLLAIYLVWMLLSAILSPMPLVGIKWVLRAFWMVGCFYVLSTVIFSQPKTIVYFFWLIGVGFALAMMIIIAKYVVQGRNPFGLRFNPTPVFRDHTLFGAFTTFFVPIFTLFIFRGNFSRSFRIGSAILLMFILMGLFFSYSRGAWASTFIGLAGMYMLIIRKWILGRIIPISLGLIVIAGLAVSYIQERASRNKAVSRESFEEHIASMTNFSTDHSNTERINRWISAIHMGQDRPIFGYGPGSYMFVYGDYQLSKYRTPVSTNRGDNGTAHNEWLLAFSEMGYPGFFLTILLFLWPVYCGFRGYFRTKEVNVRLIYLGLTFGLITYTIHALVNNFLDQDKISVTFFGILAVITALDLRYARAREAASPGLA